jgi:signal transduction histidine kinase/sensor domain CHASE-containing protein
MGIRRKMFIIIVSAFAGILLVFALSGFLLLEGFAGAEREEVRGNALRASAVFTSALDNLGIRVHDWSAWDDTYQFIIDRNPEYIQSNLTPETLKSLDIDLMVFIDREVKVVKSKHISRQTLRDRPMPDGLRPYIASSSPLIQYTNLDGVRQGVISLPEGVLLVAARPIETSTQKGPMRGTLIFGRYIDPPFVARLSKTIDFPLELEAYTGTELPADFLQAKNAFTQREDVPVIPINSETIAGYVQIMGVNGEPALIVRAITQRHTLTLGQKTILTYFIFVLLTLVIVSVGMWFLINRFVLSRMSRLTALVAESSPDAMRNIELPGTDEFSHLALVINTLTSRLQQSLRDLAESKAKDDAILASVGDGLAVADEQGNLVYLNAIGEDILGGMANKNNNRSWQEAYGVFDPVTLTPYPAEHMPLYVASQGKVVVKVPIFIRNEKHPEGVFIEVTATPIVGDGKTIGGVAIFRDMSQERAIDKAKTEFVSLASHQLRTPLTSIKWYTEMILGGDAGVVTSKQKKYLREIYSGNQRMVELVNALLSVSRLELGTFVVVLEPVDLVALSKGAIKEQKPQIDAKKIKLVASLPKGVPRIPADPKLLHMVAQNLLSNAIKYTPEKGGVRYEVRHDASKECVVLTVADTGCGIPKSQHHKVFTKLFRADNARTIDAEGTGLGLYIVKSIIDQSGGQITFESEEKKGTTFTVTFPLHSRDTLKKS